jgi:type II secretory pathway pseudopilin PulG
MGQQQLLLVILVTIIVGIATVVAINTFGSAADSANLDAVRQDMASIAASAQGYYMKPTGLNGGGQDFTGMTFEDLAFGGDITATNTIATNSNGTYKLGDGASGEISLTAAPSSADGYTEGSTGTGEDITGTIKRDSLAFDS